MSSENSTITHLVLASSSPRRRELIDALDFPVEVIPPTAEEGTRRNGEGPQEFVERLSLEKTRQVNYEDSGAVVLGADTAVLLNGRILGKPSSKAQAAWMLRALRGRDHTVITGVTVLGPRSEHWLSATESSEVTMRYYSDMEIARYVASAQPLDKAGGYAVQDQQFSPAQNVQGCYLNVVGLPLCNVIELLEKLGIETHLKRGWQHPRECRDCRLETSPEACPA